MWGLKWCLSHLFHSPGWMHCESLNYTITCCTDFYLSQYRVQTISWNTSLIRSKRSTCSLTPWFDLSLTLGDVNWSWNQDGLLSKTAEIYPTESHFVPASVTETHQLSRRAFKLFSQVSTNYDFLIKCLDKNQAPDNLKLASKTETL